MKSSMHFFHCHQSPTRDSSINDLVNKIFFEFNPHKVVPCPPPPNYHLNRLTLPPVYVRLITQSPDLQQHLIQKIINLVNSMLEQCQTLRESPEGAIQQDAVKIKATTASFSRQIEIDLSRPPGFQIMTGEAVKSIIEQALNWKKDVLTWIEATQQAALKAKQAPPVRRTVVQVLGPIESPKAAARTESWSPSVIAAAKNLQLAVAQREADKLKGFSSPANFA